MSRKSRLLYLRLYSVCYIIIYQIIKCLLYYHISDYTVFVILQTADAILPTVCINNTFLHHKHIQHKHHIIMFSALLDPALLLKNVTSHFFLRLDPSQPWASEATYVGFGRELTSTFGAQAMLCTPIHASKTFKARLANSCSLLLLLLIWRCLLCLGFRF